MSHSRHPGRYGPADRTTPTFAAPPVHRHPPPLPGRFRQGHGSVAWLSPLPCNGSSPLARDPGRLRMTRPGSPKPDSNVLNESFRSWEVLNDPFKTFAQGTTGPWPAPLPPSPTAPADFAAHQVPKPPRH